MASGPTTLADYATLSNDPLVFSFIVSLLQNGNVLNDLPLPTKPTMTYNGSRIKDNLPSPNWAALNSSPTTVRTAATSFSEQVYIIRDAIDADKYILMDQNQIMDPRQFNLQTYIEGLKYDINDKFINNNHSTGNLNAPVGIRARIDNPSLYDVNSDMKVDAGGVDLSLAGMTAATARQFLEYLDALLVYMGDDEGHNVTLYMNATMKRRFATAIRVLGAAAGFTTDTDAFGRKIDMYRSAKVVDIGRKADQSTLVITSTETAAGLAGASNYTSIYAVKYGLDKFCGWQMEPLAVEDVGRYSGGALYRITIDWAFGYIMNHTRSIGRIYDIKVS